jgi:hypothetical protein
MRHLDQGSLFLLLGMKQQQVLLRRSRAIQLALSGDYSLHPAKGFLPEAVD